jgi:urease gamma subunit
MIDKEYRKVFKTIKSCETMEQLKNAVNMSNLYFKSKGIKMSDPEYVSLSNAVLIAKAKCGTMNEKYLASGKDFANASREAGLNISGFVSEEEIEGGLADGKSVEGIADKHSVNIKDIVAQIKKGKEVEMEHTDDPNVAIEIAKDHEMEHPFYYDALENMEKELEAGAALMESFYKNKAEDRLKMTRDLQFVIDNIKSINNLEQKETAQNLLNRFETNYSKLKQIDTLVSSLQSQLDGVLSEEVEEIDEATGGASGGAYVGALGRKPIKRTIYKTDVPVADAGGMTTPVGKLYSFKKKQLKEANVITKQEIIDEALGMEAIPTYDTPGWGNSEFMLTKPKKGKKGKVRVRKGKNYKNTYKFGNNEGSTFVKIKDKCKKFPYCSQGPDAIELTKRIPEGEEKEINEMKLPKRKDIKEGWKKFVETAKREGKETTMAAKIIKKILVNEDVTEKELKFVKEQSGDILKIFGVVTMGAVSTALPILVEKMLNKKGLSILPKERASILGDREELVETISKKTGKSKNYVDSLIKRYL